MKASLRSKDPLEWDVVKKVINPNDASASIEKGDGKSPEHSTTLS